MTDLPDGAIKALSRQEIIQLMAVLGDLHRPLLQLALDTGRTLWLYKTTDEDGFEQMNLSIAPTE